MNHKKVLVFGTFDHLHPGHLYFLRNAKKLGDSLTIIIARDKNVLEIKGQKPDNTETNRLEMIEKLGEVDQAVLGEENLDNKYNLINKVNPDIIALGYDQNKFTEDLSKHIDKKIKIIRLSAYKPEKYKSSIIRNIK